MMMMMMMMMMCATKVATTCLTSPYHRRNAMGASTLHRLYPFRNYHPGGLSYNRDEYGRLVEQNIETNYRVLTVR